MYTLACVCMCVCALFSIHMCFCMCECGGNVSIPSRISKKEEKCHYFGLDFRYCPSTKKWQSSPVLEEGILLTALSSPERQGCWRLPLTPDMLRETTLLVT